LRRDPLNLVIFGTAFRFEAPVTFVAERPLCGFGGVASIRFNVALNLASSFFEGLAIVVKAW
jgi:hypothetical protein